MNPVALHYDCTVNYCSHTPVQIGITEVVCKHCGALKYTGETRGLCCVGGKVKLPQLPSPPVPLHSPIRDETPESRHLLPNTQKRNGCFQMPSFKAVIIDERGFDLKKIKFNSNSPSNWIIAVVLRCTA